MIQRCAAFLFCAFVLRAEIRITISEAPAASISAAWGALVRGSTLYSAIACTAADSPARSVSGGAIEQIAEAHAINISPAPLDAALSNSLQSRAVSSRLLSAGKWALTIGAAAGAAIAAWKAARPTAGNSQAWAIGSAGGGALSAGLQLLQLPLASDQSARQQQLAALASSFLNPTAIYPIPAGGCTPAILFFGSEFSNFKPIEGDLP